MKKICISTLISIALFLLLLEILSFSWNKYDIASGILVRYGVIVDVISLLSLLLVKLIKGKYWSILVCVGVVVAQFLYWKPYELMPFCCFLSSIIVIALYFYVINT